MKQFFGLLMLFSFAAHAGVSAICDRSKPVQNALLESLRWAHQDITCETVTAEELSGLESLTIDYYFPSAPYTVVPSDLAGMPQLKRLILAQRGAPVKLEAHFFKEVPHLTYLQILNNFLDTKVEDDTLSDLTELEDLDIQGNIATIPSRLLRRLTKLKSFSVQTTNSFPVDIFQGLSGLERLWLANFEPSTSAPLLPMGIFYTQPNVKELLLNGVLGRDLSGDLVSEMKHLEFVRAFKAPYDADLRINKTYRLQSFGRRAQTCEQSVLNADKAFDDAVKNSSGICQIIEGKATVGSSSYEPRCQYDEENREYSTQKGALFQCAR